MPAAGQALMLRLMIEHLAWLGGDVKEYASE